MPGDVEVDPRSVRRCAQEVISAHIDGDQSIRDRLVSEYVTQHGSDLFDCVLAFVVHHTFENLFADDEVDEVALLLFIHSLDLLGSTIEELSDDSAEVDQLVQQLATGEYEPGNAPEPADRPTLEAAQTCLLIHMLVRKGGRPWGVQKHLDLSDMRLVVGALADIFTALVVAAREDIDDEVLVVVILGCAQNVVTGIAALRGHTLKGYIAAYWMWLALEDARSDPDH